ncbi:RNA-binding protein, putative [Plasmodium ovale]|uniref:RNA-binding protein, putative n=1 Tax=Plasmodium ovale TaxID=36330 RepID=A0A1C3L5U8_PLAOA|nr:RNA-binding protein, putative [Plasmodium ovale]
MNKITVPNNYHDHNLYYPSKRSMKKEDFTCFASEQLDVCTTDTDTSKHPADDKMNINLVNASDKTNNDFMINEAISEIHMNKTNKKALLINEKNITNPADSRAHKRNTELSRGNHSALNTNGHKSSVSHNINSVTKNNVNSVNTENGMINGNNIPINNKTGIGISASRYNKNNFEEHCDNDGMSDQKKKSDVINSTSNSTSNDANNSASNNSVENVCNSTSDNSIINRNTINLVSMEKNRCSSNSSNMDSSKGNSDAMHANGKSNANSTNCTNGTNKASNKSYYNYFYRSYNGDAKIFEEKRNNVLANQRSVKDVYGGINPESNEKNVVHNDYVYDYDCDYDRLCAYDFDDSNTKMGDENVNVRILNDICLEESNGKLYEEGNFKMLGSFLNNFNSSPNSLNSKVCMENPNTIMPYSNNFNKMEQEYIEKDNYKICVNGCDEKEIKTSENKLISNPGFVHYCASGNKANNDRTSNNNSSIIGSIYMNSISNNSSDIKNAGVGNDSIEQSHNKNSNNRDGKNGYDNYSKKKYAKSRGKHSDGDNNMCHNGIHKGKDQSSNSNAENSGNNDQEGGGEGSVNNDRKCAGKSVDKNRSKRDRKIEKENNNDNSIGGSSSNDRYNHDGNHVNQGGSSDGNQDGNKNSGNISNFSNCSNSSNNDDNSNSNSNSNKKNSHNDNDDDKNNRGNKSKHVNRKNNKNKKNCNKSMNNKNDQKSAKNAKNDFKAKNMYVNMHSNAINKSYKNSLEMNMNNGSLNNAINNVSLIKKNVNNIMNLNILKNYANNKNNFADNANMNISNGNCTSGEMDLLLFHEHSLKLDGNYGMFSACSDINTNCSRITNTNVNGNNVESAPNVGIAENMVNAANMVSRVNVVNAGNVEEVGRNDLTNLSNTFNILKNNLYTIFSDAHDEQNSESVTILKSGIHESRNKLNENMDILNAKDVHNNAMMISTNPVNYLGNSQALVYEEEIENAADYNEINRFLGNKYSMKDMKNGDALNVAYMNHLKDVSLSMDGSNGDLINSYAVENTPSSAPSMNRPDESAVNDTNVANVANAAYAAYVANTDCIGNVGSMSNIAYGEIGTRCVGSMNIVGIPNGMVLSNSVNRRCRMDAPQHMRNGNGNNVKENVDSSITRKAGNDNNMCVERPVILNNSQMLEAFMQGRLCLSCDSLDHPMPLCPNNSFVCPNCHNISHRGNDCPMKCRFCLKFHVGVSIMDCLKKARIQNEKSLLNDEKNDMNKLSKNSRNNDERVNIGPRFDISTRPDNSYGRSVYVSNLSEDITNIHLRDTINQHLDNGYVVNIDRQDGYAFVELSNLNSTFQLVQRSININYKKLKIQFKKTGQYLIPDNLSTNQKNTSDIILNKTVNIHNKINKSTKNNTSNKNHSNGINNTLLNNGTSNTFVDFNNKSKTNMNKSGNNSGSNTTASISATGNSLSANVLGADTSDGKNRYPCKSSNAKQAKMQQQQQKRYKQKENFKLSTAANGAANGGANSIASGVVNSVANGVVNSVANGVVNSVANGVVNSVANGVVNSGANNIASGVVNSGANCASNSATVYKNSGNKAFVIPKQNKVFNEKNDGKNSYFYNVDNNALLLEPKKRNRMVGSNNTSHVPINSNSVSSNSVSNGGININNNTIVGSNCCAIVGSAIGGNSRCANLQLNNLANNYILQKHHGSCRSSSKNGCELTCVDDNMLNECLKKGVDMKSDLSSLYRVNDLFTTIEENNNLSYEEKKYFSYISNEVHGENDLNKNMTNETSKTTATTTTASESMLNTHLFNNIGSINEHLHSMDDENNDRGLDTCLISNSNSSNALTKAFNISMDDNKMMVNKNMLAKYFNEQEKSLENCTSIDIKSIVDNAIETNNGTSTYDQLTCTNSMSSSSWNCPGNGMSSYESSSSYVGGGAYNDGSAYIGENVHCNNGSNNNNSACYSYNYSCTNTGTMPLHKEHEQGKMCKSYNVPYYNFEPNKNSYEEKRISKNEWKGKNVDEINDAKREYNNICNDMFFSNNDIYDIFTKFNSLKLPDGSTGGNSGAMSGVSGVSSISGNSFECGSQNNSALCDPNWVGSDRTDAKKLSSVPMDGEENFPILEENNSMMNTSKVVNDREDEEVLNSSYMKNMKYNELDAIEKDLERHIKALWNIRKIKLVKSYGVQNNLF